MKKKAKPQDTLKALVDRAYIAIADGDVDIRTVILLTAQEAMSYQRDKDARLVAERGTLNDGWISESFKHNATAIKNSSLWE